MVIRPNEGQFQFTYPQSANSRTFRLGGISLFDFELPDQQVFHDQVLHWPQFLSVHKPVNVILLLQREPLADKLMSNDEMRAAITFPWPLIAHVEVCYRGPISLDIVTQTIFVCSDQPEIFEVVESSIVNEENITEVCLRLKQRLVQSSLGWREATIIHKWSDELIGVLSSDGEVFAMKLPPNDEENWYRNGDALLLGPTTHLVKLPLDTPEAE